LVTVTKAVPTIVTAASPTVPAGGQVNDVATLAGGGTPTGTIIFTLFGPNDATCSLASIFTSTSTVTGNGVYPSAPFSTTGPGVYNWVASYSGDADNNAALSTCGAPNESVTVTKAAPTIVTSATAAVPVGQSISDTATLSGGASPAGTITFSVFGPIDATCANAPAFTSIAAVTGNGTIPSGSFTATVAGTYRFVAPPARTDALAVVAMAGTAMVTVTFSPGALQADAAMAALLPSPLYDASKL
jgi:hypothetical protein